MAGLGVVPFTSTQRLHQSTFREWSEAQEVQLAIWKPLCLQETVCQSTHCRWTQSPKMCTYICTPVSMSGRQLMCWSTHAMHMPQVVWTCCVASGGRWGCRLWPPAALPSAPMWCHYFSPALESQASKEFISRPDNYRRPRVLLEVSYRYHSKRA